MAKGMKSGRARGKKETWYTKLILFSQTNLYFLLTHRTTNSIDLKISLQTASSMNVYSELHDFFRNI